MLHGRESSCTKACFLEVKQHGLRDSKTSGGDPIVFNPQRKMQSSKRFKLLCSNMRTYNTYIYSTYICIYMCVCVCLYLYRYIAFYMFPMIFFPINFWLQLKNDLDRIEMTVVTTWITLDHIGSPCLRSWHEALEMPRYWQRPFRWGLWWWIR